MEQMAEGLARGLVHEGKAYDFDFNLKRSTALVCTEVIYRSFDGLGEIRFDLKQRAGRSTLSGSDLISMALRGENASVFAAYHVDFSQQLERDDKATELIRQFHVPT